MKTKGGFEVKRDRKVKIKSSNMFQLSTPPSLKGFSSVNRLRKYREGGGVSHLQISSGVPRSFGVTRSYVRWSGEPDTWCVSSDPLHTVLVTFGLFRL